MPPPFTTCPQDHIMNLPNMERAGVDWREWSFPDRLPEGENNTAVLVKLAPGGESPGAEGGADTDTAVRVTRTIELPAYPTDREWVTAIGDATEKVAYVSSAVDSFCTFSDAAGIRRVRREDVRGAAGRVALLRAHRGREGRAETRVPRRVRYSARRVQG